MSDDDSHKSWLLEPEVSDEDWEVIEDADQVQEARQLGDVPGFQDADDLDVTKLRHSAEVVGAALLHYAVTGLLVTGALVVGIWGYLEPPPLGPPPADTATRSPLDEARIDSARTRLGWALEVHRIESKTYPDQLSVLVDRGLLRSRDVYYPRAGWRWHYRSSADDYRLETEATANE